MDIGKLKMAATELRTLLDALAPVDANVRALRSSLADLIEKSIRGVITTPVQMGDVPGSYLFNETDIRKHRQLESAYAHFSIEISGGVTPARAAILDNISKMR